ncbi:hypothetical protein KPH14_008685 [Odynerus spinipes]|uniref:BPTI/Kunitz inhibitor domain-containing protein n=1 Tax=Odynerus spinipes TaxID=1348599 RepID=A0AAD9RHK1_9HYME|nr:hypothetical protein KPH14_008685 [Odynerus spinipes]
MQARTLALCLLLLCVLVHETLAHHTICHHPIEVGPCKAAILRWAYDGKGCVEFTYGGCRGNPNNFLSKDECEQACLKSD